MERAIAGCVVGIGLAALAGAASLLAAEWSAPGLGARWDSALWALALLPLGALGAALRPLTVADGARALDRRAELEDTLGTAWEFRDLEGELAARQRGRAVSLVADLRIAPLFRRPPPKEANRFAVFALLVLFAVATYAQLHEDAVSPPPVAAPEPDGALLSLIEETRTRLVEEGRLEAASVLLDLERAVRDLRKEEQRLRKRLAEAPPPEPTPAPPPPEPVVTPPPTATLTLADTAALDTLSKQTADQLALAAASEREALAQLFERSKQMDALTEEFAEMMEREAEASAAALPSLDSAPGQQLNNRMGQVPGTGSSELQSRLGQDPNEQKSRMDMVRRSLDADTQGEHDYEHAMQEQFREFLKDVVKDVADAVRKAAMGEGKKKGKGVAMKGGDAVADKQDAMAESGFRDGKDAPGKKGQGTPDNLSGGDGSAGSDPAAGPPPPGAKLEPGQGGGAPPGAPSGGPGGDTTAGAQGAGSGAQAQGGGERHDVAATEGGPLQRALGRVGQGHLPPEQKELLFSQLARHKVETSERVMEADDVLLDYFSDADTELDTFSDELPPLFRALARSYFDSIRPGADGKEE